jgi:hypothetical protein
VGDDAASTFSSSTGSFQVATLRDNWPRGGGGGPAQRLTSGVDGSSRLSLDAEFARQLADDQRGAHVRVSPPAAAVAPAAATNIATLP